MTGNLVTVSRDCTVGGLRCRRGSRYRFTQRETEDLLHKGLVEDIVYGQPHRCYGPVMRMSDRNIPEDASEFDRDETGRLITGEMSLTRGTSW